MKSGLFPGLPLQVSAAHPCPLCCSSQTLLALQLAPLSQAQTLGHAVSKRPRLQQGLSPRSPHDPAPTCTTREITTVSPASASLSPHAHLPVGPVPVPRPRPSYSPPTQSGLDPAPARSTQPPGHSRRCYRSRRLSPGSGLTAWKPGSAPGPSTGSLVFNQEPAHSLLRGARRHACKAPHPEPTPADGGLRGTRGSGLTPGNSPHLSTAEEPLRKHSEAQGKGAPESRGRDGRATPRPGPWTSKRDPNAC